MCTEPVGQLVDALEASSPRSRMMSVAPNSLTERDSIGVASQQDDLFGAELRGDDAAEPNRAVSDNGRGLAGLDLAATAAWWPVHMTSASVSSDGISASSG